MGSEMCIRDRFLPAKILFVRPELGAGEAEAGWWAVGGRIPRLASEAIRDLRL